MINSSVHKDLPQDVYHPKDIYAPKEMILPNEPKRIELLGEEEEEIESQTSQKNFLEKEKEEILKKKELFNQMAPGFQISQKMNPKKFLDDEDVEQEQENSLNEGSLKNKSKKSKDFTEKNISQEHLPVSELNPSKKSLKVFRPMLEDEVELNKENNNDEDHKTPQENINIINNNNDHEVLASRKSNGNNNKINNINGSRRGSNKSQKPLVDSNSQNGNNVNNISVHVSQKNSMHLSLSPILEDPKEFKTPNRQVLNFIYFLIFFSIIFKFIKANRNIKSDFENVNI